MPHSNNFGGVVCPACKGGLEQRNDALLCASCDTSFPIIIEGVAPFFPAPSEAIACAYLTLYKTKKGYQKRVNEISEAIKTSNRKKQLLLMITAFYDNQDFFRKWMETVAPYVQPEKLLDVAENPSGQGYGYNFNYLVRDWSAQESSEIDHLQNSIDAAVKGEEPGGRACFLGVGTARFATGMAQQFDGVWGIDSSFGQLAQFHAVLQRPLEFWRIDTKNRLDSKNITQKIRAAIPDELIEDARSINYVWADTLSSPFENDFFDWVLSIYFSDVIPLPDLIIEIKRVLKPGGYFLHFGPLQYHFKTVEHHYPYNEFRQYFVDNGFEIVHETTALALSAEDGGESLMLPQRFINKVLLLRYRS